MVHCLPLASHRAADLGHRCLEPIYSAHHQEADVWALLHAHFVEQSLHDELCIVDLQGFHRCAIRENTLEDGPRDAISRSLTPPVPLFHRLSRQTISAASAVACLLMLAHSSLTQSLPCQHFLLLSPLRQDLVLVTPSGASPLAQDTHTPPYPRAAGRQPCRRTVRCLVHFFPLVRRRSMPRRGWSALETQASWYQVIRESAPKVRGVAKGTRILLGGVLRIGSGHQFRRHGNPSNLGLDHSKFNDDGTMGSRMAPDKIQTKWWPTHSRERSGCRVHWMLWASRCLQSRKD